MSLGLYTPDSIYNFWPQEKELMWLVKNHHDIVMPLKWIHFFWLPQKDRLLLARLCDYRNEATSRLNTLSKSGKKSASAQLALDTRYHLRVVAATEIMDHCTKALHKGRLLTGWEAESYYYACKFLAVLPDDATLNSLSEKEITKVLENEMIDRLAEIRGPDYFGAGRKRIYDSEVINQRTSLSNNLKPNFIRWVTWTYFKESKCPICNITCNRSLWFNQTFAFEKQMFRVCQSCYKRYCVKWLEYEVDPGDCLTLYQLPFPQVNIPSPYGLHEVTNDSYCGFVDYRNLLIQQRFNNYHLQYTLEPYKRRTFVDLIQLHWLEQS